MNLVLRVAAGAVAIAFVLYGVLMAMEAKPTIGVNSKLHGLLIIFMGALFGRYAVLGRTGLPALDK